MTAAIDIDQTGRKRYQRGTDRVATPTATLARVKPFLPIMGITRIANVTGLDRIGIPVVMVCRPNARSITVSQGKGLELDSAKASGVMEAIETYHAESITLPVKYASYDQLRYNHPMIDIDGLPICAESAWRQDLAVLWIEGHDLIGDAPAWLPYELVSADYTTPLPPGSGCFAANTNGLASGNSYVEAVTHAICELIERDATTLWWHRDQNWRARRAVDPGSIHDPDCRALLDLCARADVQVGIWDITSDIGVAAFLCLAIGQSMQDADPEFGAGCHPRREVALCRALTEAAQARATFIVGARDDLAAGLYVEEARARRFADCRSQLELVRPKHRFDAIPSWDNEFIEDDVAELLDRLQRVGIRQVMAVDLTQSAFGLPVVRAVIPGLEGVIHEADVYVPGPRARRLLSEEAV